MGTPLQGASHLPFHNSLQPPQPPLLVAWEPPPPAFFKLNFDGSVRNLSVAGGIIIRDSSSTFIQATSLNFGASSVLLVEASALHQGIQIAHQLGIQNLIIEGDNLLVIKALQNLCSIPWKIATIIQDSKFMLQHFSSVQVRHIFREANRATDWITNVGHLVSSPFVLPTCSQSLLSSILVSDALGVPLERRAA
ncbi:uncharacterized protein LOC104898725 [Beta vulgaris subsp. vulgaris]|uniref:uncharacterized protein LOC104898725 n=1 Tax=Beta vulgaris subsp. vulgaris TaxID=3555 RepID=UPI00053F5614|nr:uncharacterized protein LOC104898725 [Beta vulgaris subsp. vulgaris]